jgi:hypothetical protein
MVPGGSGDGAMAAVTHGFVAPFKESAVAAALCGAPNGGSVEAP